MEYLKSVKDPLKRINDRNIQYLDLFKHSSLVFGLDHKSEKVNFSKYSQEVQDDIKNQYPDISYIMQYQKTSPCGCRIKFRTTSKRLVFKIHLRRGYNYKNMIMWNSSGFSVYIVDKNGNYKFHKLITPTAGIQCFAEQIYIPPESSVCIFLPNFDTINKMYVGFEKGSRVMKFNYPKTKRLPILFYGGSAAQGASATKSSNSYPNVVSKILNHDIINYSVYKCCKATHSMAEMIGKIDCDSVVIDYSRDATDKKELEERHEQFYKKVREYHPEKKIILMTSGAFNQCKKYEEYDEVVINTYNDAISRGENTYLLNQKELFSQDDYDLISFNNGYYTDYAMYRVAEKICELLNS